MRPQTVAQLLDEEKARFDLGKFGHRAQAFKVIKSSLFTKAVK